jgi:thiol-disulfide isomerase/thioredoxin
MEDLGPVLPSPQAPRRLPWVRFLDLVAALVVAAALYKIFLAPRILKASSVRLPPLVFPMLDGSFYHLDRRRGRVVYLDFSTSWCEACKASLPLVEHFARSHPRADVVTIDSGESAAVAARFARERGLRPRFVALDSDERLADAFNVTGFPTIVVIDPQGRMSGIWYGYNPAIESAMEHALATLMSR